MPTNLPHSTVDLSCTVVFRIFYPNSTMLAIGAISATTVSNQSLFAKFVVEVRELPMEAGLFVPGLSGVALLMANAQTCLFMHLGCSSEVVPC